VSSEPAPEPCRVARVGAAVRSSLVLLLVLCACRVDPPPVTSEPMTPVEPPAPVSPTPEELLLETCTLDDNPEVLERTTVQRRDVEQEVIRVRVEVQPELRVETRWAALGGWNEDGRLAWNPPRLETETNERPKSHLVMNLFHREDGSLEFWVSPHAYRYHGQMAWAEIRREGDELTAELRGYLAQDYGPFVWPWNFIEGEVRMSADTWAAGDELSIFLEVASRYELRICGELRFVVPERGASTQLVRPAVGR
jgi:hypothetical protein